MHMPRFAFGKRKSVADGEDAATPSFRVLDRSEVVEAGGSGSGGRNVESAFDGGARLSAKTHILPRTTVSDVPLEDNIFADLKPHTNRYVV